MFSFGIKHFFWVFKFFLLLNIKNNKRCNKLKVNARCCKRCGNQLEILENNVYCHKCDIDDETLKSCFEDKGIICNCDYCKQRMEKANKIR